MTLIEHIQQTYPGAFPGLYLHRMILTRRTASVAVFLVSKKVYTAEEKAQIERAVRDAVPARFSVSVDYGKVYCDDVIAAEELERFFRKKTALLRRGVKKVTASMTGEHLYIDVSLSGSVRGIAGDGLPVTLEKLFFDRFRQPCTVSLSEAGEDAPPFYSEPVVTQLEDAPEDDGVPPEPPPPDDAPPESEPQGLDGDEPMSAAEPEEEASAPLRGIAFTAEEILTGEAVEPSAMYIEDLGSSEGAVTVCGTVSSLIEKVSKSNKPYLYFRLTDVSGSVNCMLFATQKNASHFKRFEDGMTVALLAMLMEGGGTPALRITSAVRCTLPENLTYQPKRKHYHPVPKSYTLVFPKELTLAVQSDLFGQNAPQIPPFFQGKTFVVFDLETTGLNARFDRITEIGAVRITDGYITHSFTTLINPGIPIPDEITRLTGIDNDMVKDAPPVASVLPDFYKFTRGCVLVAQNAPFDMSFLTKNGEDAGYRFDNEVEDTVALAQKKLRFLPNAKLDTLCKHYGIALTDHHRAWNDAYATAQVYIRLKGEP